MNLKSIICSSLMLLSGLWASAVVEFVDGGVYRFTNVNSPHVITAPANVGNITTVALDESNPRQLWVAELNGAGTGFYLRELQHGTYMTSPIQTSQIWTTTVTEQPDDNKMAFVIKDAGNDNIAFYPLGFIPGTTNFQAGYAHSNHGAQEPYSETANLVCWQWDKPASQWQMTLVDLSNEELAAYKAGWISAEVKPNKVYWFENNVHHNAFYAANGQGNVNCKARDVADMTQLWVTEPTADGEGYYLRNYVTGYYLLSPLATSTYWTCNKYPADNKAKLEIERLNATSDLYVIYPEGINLNSQNYAHEDDQHRLYSWGKPHNNSKWLLHMVESIDDAALAAAKANWENPNTTIEPNRVYHLVNVDHGNAITYNASNLATRAAADATDESQLWVTEPSADGEGYILRNYKTGGALCSSMATSEQWHLVESSKIDPNSTVMHFELYPKGFAFEPVSVKDATDNSKTYGYAHEAGGGELVCWNTNANATFWTTTPMTNYSAADIEAKRQTWEYVKSDNMENALAELFADKVCTQLNPQYASMTAEQMQQSAAYQVLPEALQAMAIKVLTGNWSETDPTDANIEWDSEHAKKLRVQLYEPYSRCDAVSNLNCIQAYTNLNNVTGILGDNGSTLYVMVEKGAAEGSTLYLAQRPYEDGVDILNRFADGVELHEGLNIVQCNKDAAQIVIYYTVQTNEGRQRMHKLSDYDDIKIHIEGGSLNGFFNPVGDELYTPDTNEDWFYYRERARHERFCLLTNYVMLYMHFQDVVDNSGTPQKGLKNLLTREEYEAGNFDLNATMAAWDQMFVAEMLVMGLMSDDIIRAEKAAGRDWYDTLEGDPVAPSDYSLYFNNRLMGISELSGFMSATWYRTKYHVNTLRSIIMQFPTMDLWGPAHEFGHMNQGPMKIAGTTEESNNVFSNVALFYRGEKTSRADMPSDQAVNFNKGYNFHQHGTWGTTRMWFQLWLYYHAAGHNKKFYPRLYELLRENPLRKNSTEHLNAKDDLLHFAKMCCIAAGEDLTDFFDAWGFLVPQDGYYIGDYTSYNSYLSEEEIEQWRTEIAQMAAENGWKKNNAIIFIDDRVGSTKPGYADWCTPDKAGSMGGLNDFISGNDAVSGNYEFSLSGNTVTVSGGTGGAGFIIYDENGRLIGFANDPVFEVSAEAAKKIAAGEATFSVMQTNNEEVAVADAVREGDFNTRKDILLETLAQAELSLAKTDFDGRKVGYLKPELLAELKSIYNDVKSKVDNGEITADNVSQLYTALNTEVININAMPLDGEHTIGIIDGGIYVFVHNRHLGEYGIKTSANGQTAAPVNAADIDPDNTAQQWILTAATQRSGTAGYYIQNVSTHKYINMAAADVTPLPMSDTPEKFSVDIHAPGFISFSADITDNHKAIHAETGTRIVRWSADAEASHWTIQLIDDAERKANEYELRYLLERSEALLAQAGEISVEAGELEPVVISGDNLYSNATCKVNGSDKFTDQTWNNLFDNNSTTIFHSDYSGANSSDGLNHYIRIELPADVDFDCFTLGYRTRGPENRAVTNAPAEVQLTASADAEEWKEVLNVTSGLNSAGAADVLLPGCLLPAGTRYVRFMVNSTTPNKAAGGHSYFTLSELRIFNGPAIIGAMPNEHATYVDANMMLELLDEIRRAQAVLVAEYSADNVTAATSALNEKYQTLLAALNRNTEQLRDLIADTRLLAEELGTNTESINPLPLTTDHYTTNAEYTGTNTGDRLTSWEVLFDNNPNTFFHSNYDGNSTDSLDHYIRIQLPEATTADQTHMVLTYQTRNNSTNTYAPAKATIEYSANGTDWTTAQELDDTMLPHTQSTAFESETFAVPAGTAYVRFTVTQNRRSTTDAKAYTVEGHHYFCVSEFGLSTHQVNSVPNTEEYPDSNEPALAAALRQARNSEIVLNAPGTSHRHYNQSYAALMPHYETLLAIKDNPKQPDAINEINAPQAGPRAIYDLQGRRLDRITTPGLYIINGRTTLRR